jgi:two-component system cell cycle response regulator DivK
MPSEPILIVDDAPANLKLTRLVLAGAGYDVRTARDAEEALRLLRQFHPRVILTDVHLPGMNGLELTRRLRTDPATEDTIILAVTGCALENDEHQARAAGFDGYIIKPYDTRKLPAIVRQHLARAAGSVDQSQPAAAPGNTLPPTELRRRFLAEGAEESRGLIEQLHAGFNAAQAREVVRRWIGVGNTLGQQQIGRLAEHAEKLLAKPQAQASAELEEILNQLFRLFTNRPLRRSVTLLLPEAIIKQLSGKRLGLIGFDAIEAKRLSDAFSNAHASIQALEGADAAPHSDALRLVDLVLFNLRQGAPPPEWVKRKSLATLESPVLFVGPRDLLLDHGVSLKSGEHDFLVWPWDAEEAVMRVSLALSRQPERQMSKVAALSKPSIVIADDDPTTVALVKATLESYQMECRIAADGGRALEMITAQPTSAVILDVNMPNLDGFEVLAALRRNETVCDIPVVFLTSRQQETDIVRAFGLGADDYIVKPFSPMELVSRLKRLIRKSS